MTFVQRWGLLVAMFSAMAMYHSETDWVRIVAPIFLTIGSAAFLYQRWRK